MKTKLLERLFILFVLVSLTACVALDPTASVDEKRGNATKVLLALNDYQSKTGAVPKSLNDLIPQYLQGIPSVPQIRFNRLEKSIYYDERSDWMGDTIVCSARVGSDYWRCRRNK